MKAPKDYKSKNVEYADEDAVPPRTIGQALTKAVLKKVELLPTYVRDYPVVFQQGLDSSQESNLIDKLKDAKKMADHVVFDPGFVVNKQLVGRSEGYTKKVKADIAAKRLQELLVQRLKNGFTSNR